MDLRDAITDHGRRTLTEAAGLIGCGTSTLGNWLNGETKAGGELLKKVADFLKIDPAMLPKIVKQDADMVLRETMPETETELWKRRAKIAEKKLSMVVDELRATISIINSDGD